MYISQVVYYGSITEVEELSSEAKQVIQDNYDAMGELSDYIEETIGTMDNDGVKSVDIGDLNEYLIYRIKEDKKAQEILEKRKPKFKLSDEVETTFSGRELHRIVALKNFGRVKTGDIGGWVENIFNLSQEGTSWIYDDAIATDKSLVGGNAELLGEAAIRDNAKLGGNAEVTDYAEIEEDAEIYGKVSENAVVGGELLVEEGAVISGEVGLRGKGTLSSGMIIE